MPPIYGHFRPYPGRIGASAKSFVEEQGYSLGQVADIDAGTSNEEVARAILRARLDLIVLPFHLHRASNSSVLDGIGVLLNLPLLADIGRLTLLMPVSDFSWGTSFQRRFDELKEARAHFVPRLLVAHESEIGTATLASRLRRTFERRKGSLPPANSSRRPISLLPDAPLILERSGELEEVLSPPRMPSISAPNSTPISGWASLIPPASGERSRMPSGAEELSEAEGPSSDARESFRRAAALGARARRNAGARPPRSKRGKK